MRVDPKVFGLLWRYLLGVGPGLVIGLAILPGAVAVLTAFFYLGDWPTKSPFDQVFYGTAFGVIFWVGIAAVFLHNLCDIESADAATYDELVVRTNALEARLDALGAVNPTTGATVLVTLVIQASGSPMHETRETALREARALATGLREALAGGFHGSILRWSAGSGYISLWRQLHRAEEALLAAEHKELLYAEALDDEGRLSRTKADGAETLLGELRRLLGDPTKRRTQAEMVAELEKPEGRALARKIRFVLNSYRDDLFSRFVRIRNAMFSTLVYVGLVGDAVLALAILALDNKHEEAVVAGMTYYLVGALVGLFAELHGAQKGNRGAVHDYGLARVRLLTIPVLSGIAAVLGVLLTRLGGTVGTSEVSLTKMFSLDEYPNGIVIAAIFGLTPGLLLERLRTQTNEYKEELVKSAAGTPGSGTSSSAAT